MNEKNEFEEGGRNSLLFTISRRRKKKKTKGCTCINYLII
jgi:hypothetical protein